MSITLSLLDSALTYAARGWPVVALHTPINGGCSCGKATCDSVGKHPRWDAQLLPSGLKSATTDPGVIKVWWTLWPDANVGVVTGSDIWVLDVDPQHGGDLSLEGLIAQYGTLPETIEAITGGGGSHFLFTRPAVGIRNRANFAPGLDTRGDGGYIVAAPSLHQSGKHYEWRLSPDDTVLADAPQWLLDLVVRQAAAPPPQSSTNGHAVLPKRTLNYIVFGAQKGDRNNELYHAAQQCYAAGYTQAEADQMLRGRAKQDGLDDLEIDKTITSAYQSVHVSGPAQNPQAPVGTSVLITAHHTDAGNAAALAAVYGDDLRYCHTRGKWLIWDSQRWKLDDDGEASRRALATIQARLQAAGQQHRALARWSLVSESTGKIRALLEAASSRADLATTIDLYDRDLFLAGAPNGTLDLRTGQCRPSDRNDYLTMRTGAFYDPLATCPRWLQFLDEIFANDHNLISWIQRAVGYTLTGDTREEVLFLCYGSGANGKSKFLEVLGRLLGDYAATASFETFNAERRSEQTNDLAALAAKRLVTAIETDEDRRLAEARVKMVTGGDLITCRFLRQEFFTYKPQFKVWLAMNHRPIVRGRDRGIWRRIRLIPFTQSFEQHPDQRLFGKLVAELPGILNWALEGLMDWQRQGLGTCAAIDAATDTYRREMDDVGQWIEEEIIDDPQGVLVAVDGYADYHLWSRNRGDRFPKTMHAWGRVMGERGYQSARQLVNGRKVTVYRSVRVRQIGDP